MRGHAYMCLKQNRVRVLGLSQFLFYTTARRVCVCEKRACIGADFHRAMVASAPGE